MRKGAEKLAKFLNAKQQGRLDGFFKAQPKAEKEEDKKPAKGKGKTDAKGTKRKVRCFDVGVFIRCSCTLAARAMTRMRGAARRRRRRRMGWI